MNISDLAKSHNWNLPTVCPICGAQLFVNDSGFPECPNEKCNAKIEHQFGRLFSILGVKIAGRAFIKKAVADCKDASFPLGEFLQIAFDYNVDKFNEWAGGINGEKILKQLHEYFEPNGKTITPAEFCAMLDWPHLSTKQFEKIPEFTLMDALNGVPYSELKGIDGIGDAVAEEMTKFWAAKKDELEALEKLFKIESKEDEVLDTNLQTICFTGACPGHSRKDLTELCKGKYNVVDSVTKDLDILACADPNSGSSKLQKAAKNGTKVISYEDLLKTL